MTKAKDELTKQLREELAELATSLQGDSYYSVLPDELGDEHIKPFLDIIATQNLALLTRLEAEQFWAADDQYDAGQVVSLETLQSERALIEKRMM